MVVHHFVIEDREIEGKTQSNWIACIQTLRKSISLLITLERPILNSIEFIGSGRFGNVSIVVTNHLLEECLGLVFGSEPETFLLNGFDNRHAFVVQL